MSSNEKLLGHPSIMYCAFESDIIKIDGHYYVQEDYQDGDIWSEDEIWGSVLYDLENKRKIEWPCYITSKSDWEHHIYNKSNWDDMEYEFESETYKDGIEYYLEEIKKLKDNEK